MTVKPNPNQYPGYFQRYVDQVPENELFAAFARQQAILEPLLHSISEEKALYAYAPGKWTIKELLQHITDTERIFAFRALCFARGEQHNLPGFEEDDYAALSDANARTWNDLVTEFLVNRKSIEMLFNSFSEAALLREGKANETLNSVANVGFILLGHFYHHQVVLVERYGVGKV